MSDLARFKEFHSSMGLDVDVFIQKAKEKGKNLRWLEVSIGGAHNDIFCFTSNGKFNGVKHYDDNATSGKACFTVRHTPTESTRWRMRK